MKGAGEPVLLIDDASDKTEAMSAEQKLNLHTLDMLVWVGSGLEQSLGKELGKGTYAVSSRAITLSNYIPLLAKSNESIFDNRQTYNLAFWTDPKLAIMAVRYITPPIGEARPG